MCMYIYIYIQVYMYMYMCIYIHICVYVCFHMYFILSMYKLIVDNPDIVFVFFEFVNYHTLSSLFRGTQMGLA